MTRLLHLCEIALLVALIAVSIKINVLFNSTQRDLEALVGSISPAIESTNEAMKQLAEASKKVNQAAGNETVFLQAESRELAKVTHDVKAILVHTDASLNDPYKGVLPATRTALDSLNTVETKTAADMDDIQPAIHNFVHGTHQLDLALSSPAILDTLHHVDLASLSWQGASADIHTETGLIIGATKEATKPKNKFLVVLNGLAHGTLTGAELVYFLTK